MKKLSQSLLLVAAAMLTAGVANAQAPTNQLSNTPAAPVAPTAPGGPNAFAVPNGGATAPTSESRGSYSQDSYVLQANTNNYANVSQIDNRLGIIANRNGGSSAVIEQTGTYNNAYQSQVLDNTSLLPGSGSPNASSSYRNEMRSTQAGDYNESRQTQVGGTRNTAVISQSGRLSSAVQTQSGNSLFNNMENSASITQAGGSSNNASQTQSGYFQSARIVQQGNLSVATQTQQDSYNSADIYQGMRGAHNTATQTQSGNANRARIIQSDNTSPGRPGYSFDYNYAKQTQSGSFNQADIAQRSFGGYAEQVQSGTSNASRITQGVDSFTTANAASAAYTTQSGTNNSVTISQR